jgi:hypothetical protein
MEHRFQVLSVRAVLKTRTITLTCSADVDEDTVTSDSLYLMHCSTRKIAPVSSEVDRRQIILTLIREPEVNQEYSLVISNEIESIVGDKLDALTSLKIVFDSAVITDVEIAAPANFASYDKAPAIKLQEVGKEEDLVHHYQLQIATDNAFVNIAVDTKIDDTSDFTPSLSAAGQYFVRARAIKDDDYGAWSKVSTFTIAAPAPEPVPNPQPEEKPRPGIPEIIDYTKTEVIQEEPVTEEKLPHLISDKRIVFDDEVPEALEISFDMPINLENATIIVKRRDS